MSLYISSAKETDQASFSHFWFATVQEVLQADWQEAWHLPQPPLAAEAFRLALLIVLICFMIKFLLMIIFYIITHIAAVIIKFPLNSNKYLS